MSTLEKLGQIILKFKKGKVAPEALKATANLVSDLDLDSIDRTELLVLAEDAFNLKISDADAFKMKTLGDVAEYIDKKLSA
ncbi:acyl carrier protein [Anaeroselena agilis]|uniref:Acyl carrier protein n=1 Tax=Anaeroselena agilis TaxID=3063788 RepID=A0ABU3P4L0_9FIRM|nr:acyl carrier protein [Selenomonadales bacterium 4137-cl]